MENNGYCIFDMDGTLYSFQGKPELAFTETDFYRDLRLRAIEYISRITGESIKGAQTQFQTIVDNFNGEISLGMEKVFGVDRYDYFEAVWNLDPSRYIEKNELLPRLLSELGGRAALLTAAPRVWADRVICYLGLQEIFKDKIYTGEPDLRKPSSGIFSAIANELGSRPSEIVSVGDQNYSDILPAKAIGMKTIIIGRKKLDADFRAEDVCEAVNLIKKRYCMKRKIIIDTDPGIDDAVAIIMACLSPQLNIKAITTVCGNSTIENTTRNARYIIDLLRLYDKIPIYSGASRPFRRELVPAVVHGDSGLEGINPSNPSDLTGNAAVQIARLLRKYPNQISIIALGPLTNIAEVARTDPEAIKLVDEIVIMGGAIFSKGNMSEVAEFNTFVDPESADVVMRVPVKKTLIPLDLCNRVTIGIDVLEEIRPSRIKDALISMLVPYTANIFADTGVNTAIMYDPITIYYLLNQKQCRTENMRIKVSMDDAKRGCTTVVARGLNSSDGNSSVQVVLELGDKTFEEVFVSTMSIVKDT